MKIKSQLLIIVRTILLILLFVGCEQSLIDSLQRVSLRPNDKIVFTMGYPDGVTQQWMGTVLEKGIAVSAYGKAELLFVGDPEVFPDGSAIYRVEYNKEDPGLDYKKPTLLLHVDSKGNARFFEDTPERKEKFVLVFAPEYQGNPQGYDPTDFTITFATE